MKYTQSIDALPSMVGGRNAALLGVVLRGLAEQVPPETIAEDLRTKAGDPPLDEAEIQRALVRAKEHYTGSAATKWDSISAAARKAEDWLSRVDDEERQCVTRMIAKGEEWVKKTWDGKRNVFEPLSPVAVNPRYASPDDIGLNIYAARAYIATVFPDDSGYVFFTNRLREKRDRSHIMRPSEFYAAICEWAENTRRNGRCKPRPPSQEPLEPITPCIPQFLCPNLHTGQPAKTSGGGTSYAVTATIATRRRALIEFDALSIWEQTYFWVGVLLEQPDSVLAITYTRGKSLHGIIEVDEPEPVAEDLFGGGSPPSEAEKDRKWRAEWDKIRRNFCSHPDPAYRCDASCSDATRTTRLPGAMRIGSREGDTLCHYLGYCNRPKDNNWMKGIAQWD